MSRGTLGLRRGPRAALGGGTVADPMALRKPSPSNHEILVTRVSHREPSSRTSRDVRSTALRSLAPGCTLSACGVDALSCAVRCLASARHATRSRDVSTSPSCVGTATDSPSGSSSSSHGSAGRFPRRSAVNARPPIKSWLRARRSVCAWGRSTENLEPARITEPSPGVHIFDFGQSVVGRARMALTAPRGTPISLRFGEAVGTDGRLDAANLRAAPADEYIARGEGVETWEPRFALHGFRYVEVKGLPSRAALSQLTAPVVHSQMDRTGLSRRPIRASIACLQTSNGHNGGRSSAFPWPGQAR